MIEGRFQVYLESAFFCAYTYDFFPKPQIQGIGAGIRGIGINTRFSNTLSLPSFSKENSIVFWLFQ